jgi:hypothetical protein
MDDTAIIFNNNGVYRWELGYHDSAWILFQGALEVLKQGTVALCEGDDKCEECDSSCSNPYIIQANHLLHCEEGVFLSRRANDTLLDHVDHTSYSDSKSTLNDYPDLQIHERAILVPDSFAISDFDEEEEANYLDSVNTVASIVLFNLGLVQHMKTQGSKHAISFYKLSLSLEIPTSMWRLKVALLNNLALLHEENDDQTSAQRVMEEVSTIIEGSGCDDIVDEDCVELANNLPITFNKEATAMNVRLILFPPGAASSSA